MRDAIHHIVPQFTQQKGTSLLFPPHQLFILLSIYHVPVSLLG